MKDGGPAFPRPVGTNGAKSIEDLYVNEPQEGMSLRDYFAAAALTGTIASLMEARAKGGAREVSPANFALMTYAVADAMLAEREKS